MIIYGKGTIVKGYVLTVESGNSQWYVCCNGIQLKGFKSKPEAEEGQVELSIMIQKGND